MGVRGEIGSPKVNLSIRVTEKEAEQLRLAAAATDVSLSWFILRAALAAAAAPDRLAVWDRR